jgi:putative ABC transport system permease protein
MPILMLAWKSLLNRRGTALLTALSIGLSVALVVGVERMRTATRTSFSSTISGTDLIVGARTGQIQLLLYSVFRIGQPTNNLSWSSYRAVAAHPRVDWSIPLSLGDSHRGYPVLGTTTDYFEYLRFGRGRALSLAEGTTFSDLYDAVLGAEVARALGYRLGDSLVIAHGASDVSFARHDDHPFRVSGILAPTGTPVDRTVHVSLEAIEAIHVGWETGASRPGQVPSPAEVRTRDLTPTAITAALVGLDSRVAIFQVQRFVNTYPGEPLMGILPGVALAELWSLVGIAEAALLLVSGFVVLVGLSGLLVSLLTSLDERRREMAVLRSVGARPTQIFALVLGEAGGLTLVGVLIGLAIVNGALWAARPWVLSHLGLLLETGGGAGGEAGLLAILCASGFLVGLIPAYRAYRSSLADGLSIRL